MSVRCERGFGFGGPSELVVKDDHSGQCDTPCSAEIAETAKTNTRTHKDRRSAAAYPRVRLALPASFASTVCEPLLPAPYARHLSNTWQQAACSSSSSSHLPTLRVNTCQGTPRGAASSVFRRMCRQECRRAAGRRGRGRSAHAPRTGSTSSAAPATGNLGVVCSHAVAWATRQPVRLASCTCSRLAAHTIVSTLARRHAEHTKRTRQCGAQR